VLGELVYESQRGGDFLFDAGEDLSVGYLSHDASVQLYLVEASRSAWAPRRRPWSCGRKPRGIRTPG
jgi:uncharacterized linocin/CFP29 family protein